MATHCDAEHDTRVGRHGVCYVCTSPTLTDNDGQPIRVGDLVIVSLDGGDADKGTVVEINPDFDVNGGVRVRTPGSVVGPVWFLVEDVMRLLPVTGRRPSQRWTRICQTCWQDRHPDDYCPDLTDMAECAVCGDYALTLSVHPEETR